MSLTKDNFVSQCNIKLYSLERRSVELVLCCALNLFHCRPYSVLIKDKTQYMMLVIVKKS